MVKKNGTENNYGRINYIKISGNAKKEKAKRKCLFASGSRDPFNNF